MRPFILGAIFARGGSKGIPNKNIIDFCGKPLIAYAVEAGRSLENIDRLIVSTDDPHIAKIAKEYGAEIPFMRPSELATDRSPEIDSWKHAVQEIETQTGNEVDILVSIPTTSPLRLGEDVQKCVDKLMDTEADGVITVREAERNPYFNMVTMDDSDNAKIVMASEQTISHRQTAPRIFDVTTVAYAVRVPFLRKANSLFEGNVKAVMIPKERALDIDDMFDLQVARFLMQKSKEASG